MLKNLSIHNKLVAMMLFVGSLVAMTLFVGVLITETISQRSLIKDQLQTTADLVAANAAAAMAFDDAEGAALVLSYLDHTPNIVSAELNYKNGEKFSSYQNNNRALSASLLAKVFPSEIEARSEVQLDGEVLGELYIYSNSESLYVNLSRFALILLAILFISIGLAYCLSKKLQHVIAKPIVKLRTEMESVSKDNDYSRRVSSESMDELGDLYRGFNDMLEQISARDKQLEHYAEVLGDEVNLQKAQLSHEQEKRIAWLENLARFLRHELKNTMIGFRSSLDLIERKSQADLIEKYLFRARNSLTFMGKLLDQVGDASSLEASLYGEEYEVLDLNSLLDQWLDEFQALSDKNVFKLSSDGPTLIVGNRIRLRQLMEKLVNNAIDHSEPKTVIELKLESNGDNIEFSIANEGQALPDDRDQLFELFVSRRAPETQTEENVGIGLYVVRLIAEAHRGTVKAIPLEQIEPEKQGAVFSIALPALSKSSSPIIEDEEHKNTEVS